MKLSELKLNPNNPQKFDDLSKLEKSIKEFPKMMSLRPMVVDNDNIVLGGNKRLICLQNMGYKEIPNDWVVKASELTEDEKKRFIIADNVGFGTWDVELLQSDWNIEDLEDWGADFDFDIEPDFGDLTDENKNKKPSIKITFESVQETEQAKQEIEILLEKYNNVIISVSAGEL